MKVESLVIANQNVAVNLYLGLVHTARHVPGVGLARRLYLYHEKRVSSFLGVENSFRGEKGRLRMSR